MMVDPVLSLFPAVTDFTVLPLDIPKLFRGTQGFRM